MRMPDTLASLADYGIIEAVLRPLMSGKEAQIFLVRSGGEHRVAKVYKEAQNRTFKHRAEYVEGRKVRNSRDQRAMGKGSRHGRAQAEAAWRTTEVEVIYRLRDAGVRVPTPYHFIDGVLVMEMITDEHGDPAPRLGDVALDLDAAQAVFDRLLAQVVRMLVAGVVHGDLSDFNVLMGVDGPVIIDFPQAVDASSNQNARKLLIRDVDNLHRFMARHAPERKAPPYAQEMWALYERGELTPDTKLTGRHQATERKATTDAVLGLIGDAARDERRRRESLGLSMRGAPEIERVPRAVASESAPRASSKYAQKRAAQLAAANAQRVAEANTTAARRNAQREALSRATQEPPRERSAGPEKSHRGKLPEEHRRDRGASRMQANRGSTPREEPREHSASLVHASRGSAPRAQPSGRSDQVGSAAPKKRRRRRRRRTDDADKQTTRSNPTPSEHGLIDRTSGPMSSWPPNPGPSSPGRR
jgi:RIO kinase 1